VAIALYATLRNFVMPDWIEVALILVSLYLLFVGIAQQLLPKKA
jgi:phosphatidylcholine synthase